MASTLSCARFATAILAAWVVAGACWAQIDQRAQQPSPAAPRLQQQLEQRIAESIRARQDAERRLQAAQIEATALAAKLAASEQRNQQLQNQINAIKQSMEALAQERKQLADRLASAEQRIAQQAEQIQKQQAEIDRLQASLAQERSVSQGLRSQLAAKDRQISTLTAERDRLQTLLNEADIRVAALAPEIERWKNRFWLWVATAGIAALAAGVLVTRRYWPRKIEMPFSASVTLGPWSVHASASSVERMPAFGVRVQLIPSRTEVRAEQQPLLAKAQAA
jgi:septal ring factor EnvC (AmiA/AmiB activator)